MNDAIRRVGDRIVSAHIKDKQLKNGAITVILEEVLPGTGILDLGAFVQAVDKLPRVVGLMMEHLKGEEEYDTAAANIRKAAAEKGIII